MACPAQVPTSSTGRGCERGRYRDIVPELGALWSLARRRGGRGARRRRRRAGSKLTPTHAWLRACRWPTRTGSIHNHKHDLHAYMCDETMIGLWRIHRAHVVREWRGCSVLPRTARVALRLSHSIRVHTNLPSHGTGRPPRRPRLPHFLRHILDDAVSVASPR